MVDRVIRPPVVIAGELLSKTDNSAGKRRADPALLEREHLVKSIATVESQEWNALGPGVKGEFHLITVVELLVAGRDRGDRRVGKTSKVAERVANLLLLCGELDLIGEVLKTTTTTFTSLEMLAGWDYPLAGGLETLDAARLGKSRAATGDSCFHAVSREGSIDKNHHALIVGDSSATQGQALNQDLNFLIFSQCSRGSGHRRKVGRSGASVKSK